MQTVLIKQHSLEITLQDTNNECVYSDSQCIEVTHTENTPKHVASHKKTFRLKQIKTAKKNLKLPCIIRDNSGDAIENCVGL